MSELQSLGSIYWGQEWLAALRLAGLDPDVLQQGEAYARHDWGLEAFIDKGSVSATAGSGRRLEYEVGISLPVLSDDQWHSLLQRIATSSARTAAILDDVVEPAILEQARSMGLELMPTAGQLEWECGCQQYIESDAMCKHAAAALYLLADNFDEDPFDLLLLRGRAREEIRSALNEMRAGTAAEAARHEYADRAWTRVRGELPPVPAPPEAPGLLTPWATDPPASAPFTAEGLRMLATETARRSWHWLAGAGHLGLDLDAATDLARRAALADEKAEWKQLVSNSGLTSQELKARAEAWRVAGAGGVAVQLHSVETLKVAPQVQLRRAVDDRWYRFEKRSRRWTMISGPEPDPEALLSSDPIAQP